MSAKPAKRATKQPVIKTTAALGRQRPESIASAAASERIVIDIPKTDFREAIFSIRGTTFLVVQQWSEKARRMILDTHMGLPTGKRENKNPLEDARRCIDRLPNGQPAIPAIWIKCAAVDAAVASGLQGWRIRGAFYVYGMNKEHSGHIPIQAPPLREPLTDLDRENWDAMEDLRSFGASIRVDPVRNANGNPDMRVRPWFPQWSCQFMVRYDNGVISVQKLALLLSKAGWHVGLGENRPGKSGNTWGQFEVVTA